MLIAGTVPLLLKKQKKRFGNREILDTSILRRGFVMKAGEVIGVGRRVSRKPLNGGEKHKGTPVDRHELARSLFLQHSERKEFDMKRTMLLALALACIFTIGLTCLPQRAMSEEMVIKAVTHMPKNYIALDPAREFLKRVNAKARGIED